LICAGARIFRERPGIREHGAREARRAPPENDFCAVIGKGDRKPLDVGNGRAIAVFEDALDGIALGGAACNERQNQYESQISHDELNRTAMTFAPPARTTCDGWDTGRSGRARRDARACRSPCCARTRNVGTSRRARPAARRAPSWREST